MRQDPAQELRKRLLAAHRFADVACQCDSGTAVLRGRVATFYQKQVAQEIAVKVEGVVTVINEINVVEEDDSAGRKGSPQ